MGRKSYRKRCRWTLILRNEQRQRDQRRGEAVVVPEQTHGASNTYHCQDVSVVPLCRAEKLTRRYKLPAPPSLWVVYGGIHGGRSLLVDFLVGGIVFIQVVRGHSASVECSNSDGDPSSGQGSNLI